jgi:hypothetical protein
VRNAANVQVELIHMDGQSPGATGTQDSGYSGTAVLTGYAAGTYTVRIQDFCNAVSNGDFIFERQTYV